MIIKARSKSHELIVLEFMYIRGCLSKNELSRYLHLSKGYEGELLFDALLERLKTECLILNDLLFEIGGNLFQIYAMLIFSEAIHVFDIKNYEGDYYYENEKFRKKPDIELMDPYLQLTRCESLLHRLLKQLHSTAPIKASLVYVNPEFTMYQAPMDKSIIYPTQLNQLVKNLNTTPSKITDSHHKLAAKLKSLHIDKFPYQKLPVIDFNTLKKGPFCFNCHSFNVCVVGQDSICKDCDYKESMTNTVLRSVEEFRYLFPDEKITVIAIYELLDGKLSKQQIRRVLKKNFTAFKSGRWTYYE